MIQNDPFKVFTFFTELNVSFGARLMIFWDIIVGHFVIQAGFGDLLTFIELHVSALSLPEEEQKWVVLELGAVKSIRR